MGKNPARSGHIAFIYGEGGVKKKHIVLKLSLIVELNKTISNHILSQFG